MTAPQDVVKQRKAAFPVWAVITFGGILTAVSLGIRSTFGVFLDPHC